VLGGTRDLLQDESANNLQDHHRERQPDHDAGTVLALPVVPREVVRMLLLM
jgi:hypothetical protein